MRRVFSDFAYGPGPRAGCFWDTFAKDMDWHRQAGEIKADLCVIGAGFTGLNAALTAQAGGASVVVLEAETPGWGASGRNGGFCCLGGAISDKAQMRHRYGAEAEAAFHAAEWAAVDYVSEVLATHRIDADVHSQGETLLAHSRDRVRDLAEHAATHERIFGEQSQLLTADELPEHGMAGPFFGAVTVPTGFALNPRKYVDGLLVAAHASGVRIFAHSRAMDLERQAGCWRVKTEQGVVLADKVVVATNGYSSEDLPDWMAARYMPTQSTIVVTRPLTGDEVQAQGWTSHQMSYDTRHLLHYFRLMPDNRFLIGMRGGLLANPRSEERARAKVRRNLAQMFPAWADVEITHQWSGLVCLSAKFAPFAGEVPGQPGLLAGFAYHGNGVAMGSYTGHLLGRQALGEAHANIPEVMRADPGRFPLGRARRMMMPPAYAMFWWQDR